MPEKQKNSKTARKHKESQHKHGGGGKTRLTRLERALISPLYFKQWHGSRDSRRQRAAVAEQSEKRNLKEKSR